MFIYSNIRDAGDYWLCYWLMINVCVCVCVCVCMCVCVRLCSRPLMFLPCTWPSRLSCRCTPLDVPQVGPPPLLSSSSSSSSSLLLLLLFSPPPPPPPLLSSSSSSSLLPPSTVAVPVCCALSASGNSSVSPGGSHSAGNSAQHTGLSAPLLRGNVTSGSEGDTRTDAFPHRRLARTHAHTCAFIVASGSFYALLLRRFMYVMYFEFLDLSGFYNTYLKNCAFYFKEVILW